jgi:hypothetical protein
MDLVLDQVRIEQTSGQTNEDASSSDEDEDDSRSPPVLLPRRGVLSAEEYESVSGTFSAYRSLSIHDLNRASALLLPPMPRASKTEEIIAMFDDEFLPEDDMSLVLSIVPEASSIHALSALFQDLTTSSGTYTIPQV